MSQPNPFSLKGMRGKAKATRAKITRTDNVAHSQSLQEHLDNLQYFRKSYCHPYIDAVARLKEDRELRQRVGKSIDNNARIKLRRRYLLAQSRNRMLCWLHHKKRKRLCSS